MLLSGAVIALSALFGIGYAHGPAASRTGWVAFAGFAVGVLLVPAAADAVSFLLAWELMAGGSTVLLLADHAARPAVRRAALWYAVMTHLSFLLLVAGFGVLALAAGGTGWGRLAASTPPAPLAGLAFVLLAVGFLAKAGLVPVHVWLPLAHPEAPSHMSAAMSAAMVKMGVYGVLLVTLRLAPGGPRWWALLLLVLGAASALYGILQASVQADLKRLLAYSSTENVGLIVTAAAVGLLLRASGQTAGADLALLAALLLALSHAAFKTVLFLGAGSVLHATGLRDLDLLGGLAARMPWTSAFGVGAMGAAALPVDARAQQPFADLGEAFRVVTRTAGDVRARFEVRAEEIAVSARVIADLIARLDAPPSAPARRPAGDAAAPPPWGRAGLGVVEAWRGTLVTRVELDAAGALSRVKVVDPSFCTWPALPIALADTIVPDFPLANKSFNLSYAGNDL